MASLSAGGLIVSVRAEDHWSAHTLAVLKSAPDAAGGKKCDRIDLIDVLSLPKVIDGAPASAFLVVKTSGGDWCKMLVRSGMLKTPAGLKPFLHIERLTTISVTPRRGQLAQRNDVFVFDQMGIDLDLGQIVPRECGEDLIFHAGPTGSATPKKSETVMDDSQPKIPRPTGTIVAAHGAEIYLMTRPLIPASAVKNPNPKPNKPVEPADFAGVFRLDIDGKFTGRLELTNHDGRLSGSFISDQTGATHSVSSTPTTPANKVRLTIAFPRSEMQLEGYLWTKDRRRLAGVAHMESHPFGFVAERTK
jgi:hypothetical protein